jgi:hypothetical protein
MADYNIKGEMTLATGSFIASAKAASNSLNGLNSSAQNTGVGMNALGGIMKKLAAGAMAAYIVKLGKESVQAAQVAGAAQNRLRMLLLATGGATEDQIKILNQQAAALEQMTVVSKDNITVVQSQLATFDLGSKAIATMTPAILDYVVAEKGAAASADEYRQMTNGLALALNGQFGALTRVGFVLDAKTKADIKSGTEMERAAAIVRVLNSTYKDFSKTAGDTAAGSQQKLATQVGNLKQSFGEVLLPVIQQVQGFMATKLIPVITGLMEKFKDGTAIKKFMSFLGGLVKNLFDFGSAIVQMVGPLLMNVLVPAFIAVGAAIVGVIKVLGAIGTFIKKNIDFFRGLITVIAVLAAAYGMLYVGIGIYNVIAAVSLARTKLMTAWTNRQAIATGALTIAQNALNMMMSMNPIGLILAAAVLLIAAFVGLWNHSTGFRKIMIAIGKAGIMALGFLIEMVGHLATGFIKIQTGPLKLLLKGLKLLGVEAAGKVLDGIENMTDGVGNFFDGAAKKVTGFADKLDGLENKKITLPKFSLPKATGNGKIEMPDISGLDPGNTDKTGDAKADKLAAKIADLKSKLKEIVSGYNDFIKNDFLDGFMKGPESARDNVLKGLDEVKKVFDAQQNIFEAQGNTKGIANIQKQWEGLNTTIRAGIADAMTVATEIENLSKELEKAYDQLADAMRSRMEGANAIGQMFATPFGTPSEISKAIASGEATVDSVISMYDKMVDAVNKRYDGIDPARRDSMVDMLTTQTAKLVELAKKREAAAKALEEAQKSLDDVLEKQASFKADVVGSIKSFGTALADLSKGNADNTIKVIKTASGTVITQMADSKSGLNTITDQLKTRLQTIKDFTKNIQELLGKGLNKDYVKQLLEAGPEAAGSTAALLATAGSDQVSSINDLYGQINSASESFGTQMSATFYGNAVSMAQAMVDGAKAEQASIVAQMTTIKDAIEAALKPLSDVGRNIGDDLIQQMIDALERKKAAAVAQAQAIAAAMSAAMAAAMANVGVSNVATIAAPQPTALDNAPKIVAPVTSPIVPYKPESGGNWQGPIPVGATRTSTGYTMDKPVPTVNVTINKNVEDAAVEGIMSRAILNAMRAK